MDEVTLEWISRMAPDLMERVTLRALTLERISALQPVGRRALALRMRMPEREIRTICDTLKSDGLIAVAASGMALTPRAEALLPGARDVARRKSAVWQMEQSLLRQLNVNGVRVVQGNADDAPEVLLEVGRAAAECLVRMLSSGMILAVSGGTTVAAVAKAMTQTAPMAVRVLPARGGVGMAVETQASTLASRFAEALGGSYSLIHLPDTAPREALKELMKLPEISEPLRLLQRTDVLLYGIARADEMAKKRSLPAAEVENMLRMGAVGEAVGCYFDEQGHLLFQASGVGLTSEQIASVPRVVAVAAGARKAAAILSVLRHHRHELLVTDEGAARGMLERL